MQGESNNFNDKDKDKDKYKNKDNNQIKGRRSAIQDRIRKMMMLLLKIKELFVNI